MRERAVARAAEPRLRQRRLAGVAKAGLSPFHLYLAVLVTLSVSPIFSLGRNLPPDWGCIPKQPDFVDSACVRVIRLTWGRVEDFGSSRAFGRSGGDLASEFTTACQGAPGILSSDFGQRRAVTRETSFRPISSRGLGAAICDTQAGVPSARRLEAQLAFKDFDGSRDSAIHTKYRISLVLHRSRARYPLRVVLDFTLQHCFRTNTVSGLAKAGCLVECSLTLLVPGFGDIRKLCVQSSETGRWRAHNRGIGYDNDPSAGSPTETLFDFSFL
ncbi:hypothetical protein Bca4012_102968 [Brassica carinata]